MGKTAYDVQAPGEVRPRLVGGRFFPNGTSTSPLEFEGEDIESVIRSGTAGTFTVTMKSTYPDRIVSAIPGVQHTTAVDLKAQFGDFSNLGTSTAFSFVVRLVAVATPTDMTANANSSVSFLFLFNESGA
jgi:hypothetical protein